MNKNKKKIILTIGIFILVILLGVGITYAFFTARIIGNESTSSLTLEAGELTIDVSGGNNFNASGILPNSSTAFATKTITLNGKNTTINLNMPYTMRLVVDNNTFSADAIKYKLTAVNTSNSGTTIPSRELTVINNTIELGEGFFERGNNLVHTYTLELFFPDTNTDQSADMNASFAAHVEVSRVIAREPAPKNWWTAESNTLLGAIRDNSTVHKDTDTGMTEPGKAIATNDEGLRMTKDDYGISYYFRGAVDNNYVVFANKCWRIVRVTGSGDVKLLLHNNDGTNCDINDYSLNMAKYDGTNYTTVFDNDANALYTSVAGLMYGDYTATTYNGAQANINDTTILTNLKAWYDLSGTFTSTQKSMLADTIWCSDKSLSSGVGYGNTETIFGAGERNGATPFNSNPTLICPSITGNPNLSKYTASTSTDNGYGNGALNGYKIGLLTADEAVFAGGILGEVNDSYYLASGTNSYWTMTPDEMAGTPLRMCTFDIGINSYNGRLSAHSNENVQGLRPAIALPSTTNISSASGQDGTASHPYIVSES